MGCHTTAKSRSLSLLDGSYTSCDLETGISGFEHLVRSDESVWRLSAAELHSDSPRLIRSYRITAPQPKAKAKARHKYALRTKSVHWGRSDDTVRALRYVVNDKGEDPSFCR